MGFLWTAAQSSDHAAGAVARTTTTWGQVALVCLGAHLAADRLDDHLLGALVPARDTLAAALVTPLIQVAELLGQVPGTYIGWSEAALEPLAATLALITELVVIVLLVGSFLLTPRDRPSTWTGLRSARSVHTFVLPIALAGVLLAGTWSLAMAAEDLLPASSLAPWAAALLALAVATRFAAPAWTRALAALDPQPPWHTGLRRSLVLVPFAALTWWEALPLRGGLQLLLEGTA